MPFPFVLSTTSHLTFQSSLISSTHPSLASASTSQRSLVRSALKAHKRLPRSDQANNLPNLTSVLTNYLQYLSSLDLALSGKPVSGEDVDVALIKEIDVEWRPTLSASTIPGRDNERVKGKGLDYEIYFTLHMLALTHALTARQSLLGLYASTTPSTEQRTSLIQSATKALKSTYTIHAYLCYTATSSSDGPPSFPPAAIDISSTLQSALQHLTQAELNLLAVLKDDPYPALVIQSRNKSDRDWMFAAPSLPKVRAQVLRRLCVGAAEQAGAATAVLSSDVGRKVVRDLVQYCEDVQRTARAKACRFAAIDADLAGETGEGIAWLNAGLNEVGVEVSSSSSSRNGKVSQLKISWNERREERRVAKGNYDWGGADGGKGEEGRILEYLHQKFTRENDAVNVQIVPEWKPLMLAIPSGMNMSVQEKWRMPVLGEEVVAGMRALPDDEGVVDSSDDEDCGREGGPVGAFPGTKKDYDGTSYY